MHIIGHDHYVLNDILHQNEFRPDICMACYRYLSKEDQELRQAKKKNGELFVVSQTSDKNIGILKKRNHCSVGKKPVHTSSNGVHSG